MANAEIIYSVLSGGRINTIFRMIDSIFLFVWKLTYSFIYLWLLIYYSRKVPELRAEPPVVLS